MSMDGAPAGVRRRLREARNSGIFLTAAGTLCLLLSSVLLTFGYYFGFALALIPLGLLIFIPGVTAMLLAILLPSVVEDGHAEQSPRSRS
jgi:hypothetical protein